MKTKSLHEAYEAALEDGYSQAGIARGADIPVGSLRQFRSEESLGPEYSAKLRNWLVARGFFGERIVKDPFDGIIAALRSLANDLEVEARFPVRVQRLMMFVDLISRDPVVIGFQNADKAGQE